MNRRFLAVTAIASMAIGFAAPAAAAVITTLFNTGTGSNNTSVTGVGVVDEHWTLADGTAYVSGQNGVFPVATNWLAENSVSRWITPAPLAGATLDPTVDGTYTYTLTFSLAGYKAGTAALSGRFAADNEVLGITLNGTPITSAGGGFSSWTTFTAAGGTFLPGVNTLSFNVSNFGQASGNPSGLRVELGGTAAVPEPQSWVLLVAGFGLVGIAARRRSKVVAA